MRNYMLSIWNAVDPVYFTCTRLEYVPDNQNQNTLFRVRMTRYKGTDSLLSDGTMIHKNDLLLKIHLHNVRLVRDLQPVESDIKRAVFLYHKIKYALPKLAAYLKNHPKHHEIKGVIGITSLSKGTNKLGFETFSIKNSFYRNYKKISFLPIHLLAGSSQQDPVYLFMSKESLINKYGTSI